MCVGRERRQEVSSWFISSCARLGFGDSRSVLEDCHLVLGDSRSVLEDPRFEDSVPVISWEEEIGG